MNHLIISSYKSITFPDLLHYKSEQNQINLHREIRKGGLYIAENRKEYLNSRKCGTVERICKLLSNYQQKKRENPIFHFFIEYFVIYRDDGTG
jgi:hypothetical protein